MKASTGEETMSKYPGPGTSLEVGLCVRVHAVYLSIRSCVCACPYIRECVHVYMCTCIYVCVCTYVCTYVTV